MKSKILSYTPPGYMNLSSYGRHSVELHLEIQKPETRGRTCPFIPLNLEARYSCFCGSYNKIILLMTIKKAFPSIHLFFLKGGERFQSNRFKCCSIYSQEKEFRDTLGQIMLLISLKRPLGWGFSVFVPSTQVARDTCHFAKYGTN